MTEIYYRIATNPQRFTSWSKKTQKKLEGEALVNFNEGYKQAHDSTYFVKASFVCYWEIYSNASLAKVAPAITQASLMHLAQRFAERGQEQEANLLHNMLINFARLLSAISEEEE